MSKNDPAERTVRDIRPKTRKQCTAEEKIRIVVSGLRGEESIAALCRREGIAEGLVRQANWQKVGGASPLELRSNRTTFLREPYVGFRPGRGAHDALDALAFGIERRKVSWIVDADIRAYFDTIPRDWLITFLEHRIGDRRVIRLIRKWLNAGVMDGGSWTDAGMGTPQGAIVSPVLANVFLHYVLDLWFHKKWRPNVPDGEAIIVRYADDIVVGFQHKRDAERYLRDVRERLARFGLSLHQDKTR